MAVSQPLVGGIHVGATERRARLARDLPTLDDLGLRALGLTRREMAVLERVAAGQTNDEIGHALGISPLTVKSHLEHIAVKLGGPNRAALVAHVWRHAFP